MTALRSSFLPTVFSFAATISLGLLSACQQGDVGAPCNHGSLEAPNSIKVTFPALSCNELLCVYADETDKIGKMCSECSEASDAGKYECVNDKCKLTIGFVLEKSMCSRPCSSDSDCQDSGGQRNVAKDTACEKGFTCKVLQAVAGGEFCCEKICVCKDNDNLEDKSDECKNAAMTCSEMMDAASTGGAEQSTAADTGMTTADPMATAG